ncbi:MAG: LCP family protein [Selenomonadaceae bacterium]|nr:LCP family protein [Selenomonadaceae bacterium]
MFNKTSKKTKTGSHTDRNIKELRKVKTRRATIRYFRLLILALCLWLVGWVGYHGLRVSWNIYNDCHAQYEEYLTRRTEREKYWDHRFDGYYNTLILGIGNGIETGSPAADTLVVASMDKATGQIVYVAIPRGTAVTVPAGGNEKVKVTVPIGSLYSSGGTKEIERAVREMLGITIHQYVSLDMETAAHAIDILGGIDLYVPEPMRYEDPEQELVIRLDRGYRHFDGQDTMRFLRYRGGELGDIGRVERQQGFLRALCEKLTEPMTLLKLPGLVSYLQRKLDTNGEMWDALELREGIYRAKETKPRTILLPGMVRNDGRANWQPDKVAIDSRMRELFPKAFEEDNKEEKKDGGK